MRYYEIPGTGLQVSRIALGAGEFGGAISEQDAFKMMDRFCESGGNLIDTAHIYCDWVPGTKCASEKIIGKWLAQSPYKTKVILSTKGAHPPLSDMHHSRLSKEEITSDCDESLSYLGIGTIDLYWLHRDDESRDAGEIIETLNTLKKAGKIRHFGASNWRFERIMEANQYAQSHGLEGFCASQIQWSLAQIEYEALGDDTLIVMDAEEKEKYVNTQLTVMAYSALAKGYFTKMADLGADKLSPKANNRFHTPINQNRLEKVLLLKEELGITVTAVALGYITSHRLPGIAIIGSKTIEQLQDSLSAADIELPIWAVDYLEAVE